MKIRVRSPEGNPYRHEMTDLQHRLTKPMMGDGKWNCYGRLVWRQRDMKTCSYYEKWKSVRCLEKRIYWKQLPAYFPVFSRGYADPFSLLLLLSFATGIFLCNSVLVLICFHNYY